jgi:ribosomal protein L12E/L44/L45/RPP1/RPP2
MKKLLTVLAITTIAMTSMFAKSAQVQLINTIDETELTYVLAYAGVTIEEATTEKLIKVSSLTADGKTKDITVTSNSNLNSLKW